jgi:hypothetical protein|tara:strand:+ start:818 stop:1030 length:213 start_codon:yes stop_codon:yes gene_type:complete
VKSIGLILILLAFLILSGYGVYEMLLDEELSKLMKFSLTGLYFGFVVVFVGVLTQRLKEQKSDKYIGVEK